MDSPQSVVSPPFKNNNTFLGDSEKLKSSRDIEVDGKEAEVSNPEEEFTGVIDVYIHQARDIHNICIYHKQDVYAKVCMTSNPENTVSTKTINGGGRNPVFNENLRLNVRTVDCSVKCEIWMLSRVKNYLEDQLLGFALVPLSEVLVTKDGKLEEKEFSLSSTDLFHTPAGFVQLSLCYSGSSPDVMAISAAMPTKELGPSSVVTAEKEEPEETTLVRDLDKIEFPDPKIVNEDHLMVSEYFGISQCSDDSLATATDNAENRGSEEAGVHLVESFSAFSESTNGGVSSSPSSVAAATSDESESKSPTHEQVSGTKEKRVDVNKTGGETESDSSNGAPPVPSEECPKKPQPQPVWSVNIEAEAEPRVVQQEIVDMYMKSMQQFTESLAKMKLPMDIESSGPTSASSGNSSSGQKLETSKSGNSRVFYGSRAFF